MVPERTKFIYVDTVENVSKQTTTLNESMVVFNLDGWFESQSAFGRVTLNAFLGSEDSDSS